MQQRRLDGDAVDGARAAPALSTDDRTEQALLERVAGGELQAFEALYRRYHPRLLRFLDRTMRRPGLVEEVLDDTMYTVWTRAERYNGQCKVSSWIFAIAYRKALKALHRLDEPVEDPDADLRLSDDPGPEQRLDQLQSSAALLAAIDSLSAEHRAVVYLTYFHGADCREIARIVDCPVATVKTRVFYARRRLRALLAGRLEVRS